jgi:transposase
MPKRRRTFAEEFKRKAVELTRTSSKSVGQIAKDIDVGETALRRWMAQYAVDAQGGTDEALTTKEREELRELRRKVRELEMEREILKKATAFFAREST